MGNRGLVLDGNTGGTPTGNSGEPGAVLRLALVAARLLPAGATLRRGRQRDSAVRLPDLTHRFERDPLLKVGAGAMILALGFAIVVAVAAFLDRPIESAAAKPEVKSATEPARSLRPRRRSVGREGHTFAQVPGNTRTSPPIGLR